MKQPVMNKLALLALPLLALPLLFGASVAEGQAPLLTTLGGPEGFGTDCLHANDDQSSNLIDLSPAFPAGLRFFGTTHTSVYVNTNGNITFSGALSDFTPDPFPIADRPMIAPYWADIDIRPEGACTTGTRGVCTNPTENGVWWALEEGRMIVTWDDVGYFSCNDDKRMRFQLLLTAVPSCGGGATDFDVEFRYNVCEWETGDIGGTDGFGGTEAQVGFDAGNSTDFVTLPGSREAGISTAMCTGSNIGDPGVWRFQIRSGAVVCPDAGDACTTGMPGVCTEGVTQCVGSGTECQPIVPSSDEVCDALDNDCDGETDEGMGICPGAGEVCDRGRCVEDCFEGGCPEGQTCTAAGQCLDAGCEDVECEAGQRCVDGTCQAPCDGVTCPTGQTCRGGSCLDLCAEITCDPACTACVEGECVVRCDLGAPCEAGETCTEDGTCVATSCLGVTCPNVGEVCVAGTGCVDACEGAVCPNGESCEDGACQRDALVVPPPMTDSDGGVTPGGGDGSVPTLDGGDPSEPFDGGLIPGMPPPPPRSGCGCTVPSTSPSGHGLLLLPLAGLLLLRRRR